MEGTINTDEKVLKDLGLSLTRTNIVVEWKKLPEGKIKLNDKQKYYQETELNTVCKVLAVGNEVKTMKPGQYALMGGEGRLVTLNGTTMGVIKEHMVDMVFDKRPVLNLDFGKSEGTIKTDLTAEQLSQFSEKHKYQK
jgi:hypothetical protein